MLTILEDDDRVDVVLVATPTTINENGGVSTITMWALQPVTEAVTVTVLNSSSAAALSADPVLTIAKGQTQSTGTVTLTALHDTDTSG